MEGIGDDGVTIRMCIKSGKLTLYVSYLPNPSEALHDNQATIASTDQLAIDCKTFFKESSDESGNSLESGNRKRRQASQKFTTIYIAIVGEAKSTEFSMNSETGNVTIGKRFINNTVDLG